MSTPVSGLASGFDWSTMVDQLAEVERAPQRTLLAEQTTLQERNNALGSLKTQLGLLRNRVTTLKDSGFFDSRAVTSSDSEVGTASASAGAAVGRFTFAVSQLATTSVLTGSSGMGRRLNETEDVSGLALSTAGFANAVTAGTFTVNGEQIAIESTDTLGDVFEKISSATDGAVTAGYDPDTDRITLSSDDPIILGSATDTSNFRQVAKLYGNNATSVTSGSELGAIRLDGTLEDANLTTALEGGDSGAFKINGVTIEYDTGVDSLATLLDRINGSGAGVLAAYDAANDRFTLTNKNTGSVGIALEDLSGNFLEASGLTGGSMALGKNLEYTINGGGALTSQSNTITATSSGLTGLSAVALDEGSFTVTVGIDSDKIRSSIQSFVTEYNRTQAAIASATASSTDSSGKVTAGILADDPSANELSRQLRSLVSGTLTGLSGSITRLDALGFDSNGYDDTLSMSDLTGLNDALNDDLGSLKSFFSDSTNGLATKLDSYLESTIGEDGSITTHQSTLTNQADGIDTQVSDMEKMVQENRQRLIDSFVAMEKAQATINQQLQYLLQQFSS